MSARISHKALFEKLRDTEAIRKSVQYAHWTLPALMADLQARSGGKAVLERDYQEVGALLTNHLASKLAGLLFPSSRPFFKVAPSQDLVKRAELTGAKKSDLLSGLARMEMDASQQIFLNASYNQLVLAVKHLIVTGNVLTYRDTTTHRTTTYGLQSYVQRRDGKGVLRDCVLREHTYVEALDEQVQEVLKRDNRAKYSRPEQVVEVFTHIKRTGTAAKPQYSVSQEVDTTPVGTLGTYPEHLCPWQAITWNLIPGEHYGRGMVEDYAGGFAKLSDMSEAQCLYSVEIMRVIHLVSAGSGTDIDDIANAETGEYVVGSPDTVKAHESGDGLKLQQVSAEIAQVVQRLSKAFMYQANTRNAERVTAFELAQDAREAENALGGVYSSLAESWQVPMAHVLLMESKPDALEGIISEDLKLGITAGIPALSRAADVQNLISATQEAAAIVPVLSQLDRRVDPAKVFDIVMAGQSVDTSVLYKSEDQLKKDAEANKQIQDGKNQVLDAQAAAASTATLGTIQ